MNTRAMSRIRWSDNDRYWGPFTYASGDFKRLAFILGSGDGDDYPGCRLRLSIGSRTLIVALPPIVRPYRIKVTPGWDLATITRLGRDYYWDQTEREYGFSYDDGHLDVRYGRQTHDSRTEKRWGWFAPWTQWRHVRHSLYDLEGYHFADMPEWRVRLGDPGSGHHWKVSEAIEAACPTAVFAFTDYDGEALTATTKIEEREWLFGTSSFKWLSLFRRPKVQRSLDIRFSGETGRRKGSWKGGTVGHGIDMLPGELHESAFRRYCAAHEMTFIEPTENAA